MRTLGRTLQTIGWLLGALGAVTFAGILAIVMFIGSWPDYLEFFRERFALAHELVGGWAWWFEGVIFVGPGALIYWTGNNIVERARYAEFKRMTPDEVAKALGVDTTPDPDPDGRLMRDRALADAEREWKQAKAAPGGLHRNQFTDAVDGADAKLRALDELSKTLKS